MKLDVDSARANCAILSILYTAPNHGWTDAGKRLTRPRPPSSPAHPAHPTHPEPPPSIPQPHNHTTTRPHPSTNPPSTKPGAPPFLVLATRLVPPTAETRGHRSTLSLLPRPAGRVKKAGSGRSTRCDAIPILTPRPFHASRSSCTRPPPRISAG
jgi:hypothetical protein